MPRQPSAPPDTLRRALTLGGLSAVGATALGALSACGGSMEDDPQLRFVNGSVDKPGLDLLAGGLRFNNLPNGGGASFYRRAAPGTGNAVLRDPGGSVDLATAAVSLQSRTDYTLIAHGPATALKLQLLVENEPAPLFAGIALRGFHGLPAAGGLEIHITAASTPLAGRTPELVLGAYESLSGFQTGLIAGTYRLRVTTPAQTQLLLDVSNVRFDNGSVNTLAVLPPAGGAAGAVVTVLPQGRGAVTAVAPGPS